jgi:hypothetical protein
LGGNANRIAKEALNTSEYVQLSFLANGQPVFVERICQTPTGKMKVVETDDPHKLSPQEMSGYMLDKLNLPKIYRTNMRKGKPVETPLSFNDLARALFIDRDISYPAILSEMQGEAPRDVVRILMGLTTREIAEAENRQRELELQQQELQQDIRGIKQFLAGLNVPSLAELEQRRQNLQEVLARIDTQEQQISDQSRRRIEEAEALSGNDSTYRQFREELLRIRQELSEVQQEIHNLTHHQQEKRDLKAVIESEQRRINRHLSAQHVVSSFTFTQCPRCLQPIDKEMQNRELEGLCMLCSRPFDSSERDMDAWRKAYHDVTQLINESDQLLEHYAQRKEDLQQRAITLSNRLAWLEQQLEQASRSYVAPLVEEVRLKNAERASVQQALNQIDYQERQRRYAVEYEEVHLPQAMQELEALETELQRLQQNRGSAAARHEAFLHHFRYFIDRARPESQIDQVAWSEADMLPTINGQAHTRAVSGADLALVVLAFHYALLAMAVSDPRVNTNHPKILVIDEPEQQKMGKDRYNQVLQVFSQLAIAHKDQVQIIIATDSQDVPPELDEYAYALS